MKTYVFVPAEGLSRALRFTVYGLRFTVYGSEFRIYALVNRGIHAVLFTGRSDSIRAITLVVRGAFETPSKRFLLLRGRRLA